MEWAWVIAVLGVAGILCLQFWHKRRFARLQHEADARLAVAHQAARRELLDLQARQKAVLDSMNEGILILDPEDRIELFNSAYLKLLNQPSELRGKTVLEAMRLHELQEMVEGLTEDQKRSIREIRLPDDRWIQVSGSVIASEDNKRNGSVLVFHDLTQLKRLQRTREDFVANVSHELRTPLSLIKGAAETLLDSAPQDREVNDRFLHMIDRNAERLRLLIEDLLVISELESGKVALNPTEVNLKDIVSRVVAELSSSAGGAGTKVCNQVPDLELTADPGRLEQVFFNLIENAIKYGRQGGEVRVSATVSQEGQITAEVRDDGPGIPPEAIDRIFERFFRIDKARSRERGGTGLGLAIVKHIVQSHSGKVWVESKLGKGSAFFVSLPVNRPERAPR